MKTLLQFAFFTASLERIILGGGESGAMHILNCVYINIGLSDINLILNYVEAVEA